MTTNFANPSYMIAAGETLSGTAEHARKIEVACGRIWLTIEGQLDDHWLSAGESVVIPARRSVVIEAEQHASLIELSAVSSIIELKHQAPVHAGILKKLADKLNQALA